MQGFTFNATNSQSLTFGLPSPATSILFNSTITSIQLSGISFFYKPEGYRTLITIQGTGAGIPVCIPVSGIGGKVSSNNTQANVGPNILDWSDIPQSMVPTFNGTNLCFTPPVGPYLIDPLAIDGSGKCNNSLGACLVTLTTSSSPDVIVALETTSSGAAGGCSDFSPPTDTSSLTWNSRVCIFNGQFVEGAEYYAIAASTLTADVVTCNNNGIRLSCNVFGISGANTGSPFDSNGAVPCTNSIVGPTTTPNCTISTSNANDIILLLSGNQATPAGPPTCSGYTVIQGSNDGQGSASSCYIVQSSTLSGFTLQVTLATAENWVFIGDAIKQAGATTVSQPIKITTDNSAPACSVGITGGSPSNSSFNGNGNVHTYTLSATTTITLTLTASTNTRCEWNVSPHPTASLTITFTTCGTPGPCSQYTNTSYYQHRDNYSATPVGPVIWDVTTSFTVTGTFLGAASQTVGTGSTTAGGGTATIAFVWTDYNRAATVQSPIHSNWNAFPAGSNVFTQTTGGHSNNVNYAIAGGTSSGAIFADFLIAAIVLGFMITGVFVARRNR